MNDARPTHAFTVDLEEWFHGIELPEDSWPAESRLRIGLDRLLDLLDRHDTRATFFVLGAVAQRFPSTVAAIAGLGHEVGCHSLRHRFVYRQTPEDFRADLRAARDAIGDATGNAPRGYRAPYFSITGQSRWALDILAEEGFAYDTSVFPVHNPRYGIPDSPRHPHDVATAGGPIREFPITTARAGRLNVPFSGGAYLRILPWWAQAAAWKLAERERTPVIAYIHPWELDPDHPRIPLPRRVAATHYARLHLTAPRLERLLSSRPFGRLDEVFSLV